MTLRQFVIGYPLESGYLSEAAWTEELKKFKKALRSYWLERGIVVSW